VRPAPGRWLPRIVLGIVAAGLLAAVISISVGEGGPQPEEIGEIGPVQQLFGGIAQEGAVVGPEDAEVTVTVFTDLRCPNCGDYQIEEVDPLVEEYARTGRAKLELRHFSLGEEPTTLAADAATAAGEQGRQWQYADLTFRNLEAAGAEADDEFLREIAEAVPELDTDQWEADLGSPEVAARLESDADLAADLELPGTGPSVIVSGPGGTRELFDSPSREQVESAIAAVG
jgi:protein-disulfide isomerase